MKYIYCAIALLLVLTFGCCMVVQRVSALTGLCIQQLEQARLQLSSAHFDEAAASIRQVQQTWLSHKGFWASVLRHSEIEELEYDLAELLQKVSFEEPEELLPSVAVLQAKFRHLAEMEQAHPYNFL